eukprot:TRINITY_DN76242_c0_g1_i1.p1 TRINITY_DN76242_c0_g1~~TRINITY_DN76242_c0_g1_i1.p1  ORF type:complete len:1001 (-),score=293.07 TRINITY_DN76242_c0_g1_i1:41-3043(-)
MASTSDASGRSRASSCRSMRSARSASGLSAGGRARQAMSPEEQVLADGLQEAGQALENQHSSTSSSAGSEARDRLSQAEAAERDLEVQQSQRSRAGPSKSPTSSSSPRALRDLAGSSQSPGLLIQGDKISERILGMVGESSGFSRAKTESHSDPTDSSGCSGDTQPSFHLEDMRNKVSQLTSALSNRDDQQVVLLQKLTDMEGLNQEELKKLHKELKEARSHSRNLESSQDKIQVQQAGERARHASKMAFAEEQNAKLKALHEVGEKRLDEQKLELAEASTKLLQQEAFAEAQRAHHKNLQDASTARISGLERMLSDVTRELHDRQSADTDAAEDASKEEPGSSSSAEVPATSKDRQDQEQNLKENKRLRDQLNQMIEERAKEQKDMSNLRLELLGVKTESRRQAILEEARRGQGKGLGKGHKGGQKGRSKGSAWPRGAELESIDEEDDVEDLPSTHGSLNDDGWASECVSSDAGDSVDEVTNPDSTAQMDFLRRLQDELDLERAAKQAIKDNHASDMAEQKEAMEQLFKQLNDSNEKAELLAAESEQLRTAKAEEAIKNMRQLDAIHLMMRHMEERVGDQQWQQQKDNRRNEEKREQERKEFEERLNLSTEALRIAGLRLADAQQQQAQETVRQKREISNMKIQLALERQRKGTAEQEEEDGSDTHESHSHLQRLVTELQEERSELLGKLEAKEVQFQMQLEELELQNASKIQDLKGHFDDQIRKLTSEYKRALFEAKSRPETSSDNSQEGSSCSRPEAQDEDLRSNDGAASSSSTPISLAVAADGDNQSSSSASLPPPSKSTTSIDNLKSMVWSILNLVPNVAALLCRMEGVVIQKASDRASSLLGADLEGKSFVNMLREKNAYTALQRELSVNQYLADSNHAGIPGFSSRKIGSLELDSSHGRPVNAYVSMATLPSSLQDRSIVVILSEQVKGARSSASSDICPSDSVSVQRRRPQMAVEVQRKLRSSFFSSRFSASSTPAPSSPRGSIRTDDPNMR